MVSMLGCLALIAACSGPGCPGFVKGPALFKALAEARRATSVSAPTVG